MSKIKISNNWVSIEGDYLSKKLNLVYLQSSIRLDSICKMECYSDHTSSRGISYCIVLFTNHSASALVITYEPSEYNLFIEDMKTLNSNLYIE